MRFDKARVAVVLLVSLVVLVAGLGSGERGAAAQVDGGGALEATPTPLASEGVADPAATSPQAPDCTGLPDLVPYAYDTYEYPVVPNSIKNTDKASSILYADKPIYFDWSYANIGDCGVTSSYHVEVRVDGVWFIRYPYNDIWAGGIKGFIDWGHSGFPSGWHTITMVVDPDNVIAESNEGNNTWSMSFYWEPVNNWWGEYYNNQNLEGDPVLVRDDPTIDFEWQANSPGPGVNTDHFSVRWTQDVDFNNGAYRFHLSRDDGMRFFIDGQKLVDKWDRGVEDLSIVQNMTSGSHALRLEAMDIDGFAVAKLSWERCFSLTKTVNPSSVGNIAASPEPNCGTSWYAEGTRVTLTPYSYGIYSFSHWSGDLSGTTEPKTLTMNSNKSVIANFSLPCYTLTRTSSSGGGNPTADPLNSTGCANGQYIEGEAITLTASPNSDHRVKSWSGTANDSSTATTNTVTMPDHAHTVSVTYEPIPPTCYTLTRTSSSGGGNPTANPLNSTGCANGQYVEGEAITLTASPNSDHRVKNWSGTNNNASASTTNTVTMPDHAHTVSVTYEPIPPTCYTLTRTSSSGGGNPTADPLNSTGCANGQYVEGEAITLTASPNSDHRVKSWSGTNNNASTSTTNTVTMPDHAHTVSVTYEAIPIVGTHHFFVPLATHQPRNCFPGPGEQEPNNNQTQANGPLCASGTYSGLPNDLLDYFVFDTSSAGPISVEVADHRGGGVQLQLFYETIAGNPIDADTSQHDGLRVGTPNGAAGRYYAIIYAVRFYPSETHEYTLRVSFPEG